MKLKIHHFFDIIRDFGIGKKIKPHPYGHSYHKITELIRQNPNIKIKIVSHSDDVCNGCIHLIGNHCDDLISHRKDFISKEKFNNYLDIKILSECSLCVGDVTTPIELCEKAKLYLNNIEKIYKGNNKEHTQTRKNNVIKGLKILQK